MQLYRTIIQCQYLGVIAAHSENEAIDMAFRMCLPGIKGKTLERMKEELGFAELIDISELDSPKIIV